jgi:L-lactate dehydrogenase complex protein LldF
VSRAAHENGADTEPSGRGDDHARAGVASAARSSTDPFARPHTSPLDVELPYDIRPRAAKAVRDVQLRQFVTVATSSKDTGRKASFARVFGERSEEVRSLAASIKQHTLDHLDHYLAEFVAKAEAAGVTVHFATDAAEANAICLEIARRRGCKLCVKSKSMVTEETGLVPALEKAGITTIETDLGEFILQIDGDAPSHIVTPMIHKDRTAVGRAFARELGVPYTEDPRELTMIARNHLREMYRRADLGISGANFLVASTGSIVLCTNEGNGRFCTGVPRMHIAVAGIEKVVPTPEHLAVMLKVLARSSTAQPLTCYTQILTGPKRPAEPDGPEELHLVLLDNGRTNILRAETRELLRCIRCGACLNACPVYRRIGGHSYGAVYSGPIGAAITPLLKGLHNYADLPKATSLCGSCFEACPVKIDLPHQFILLRERMVREGPTGRAEKLLMRAWAWSLSHSWTYRLAAAVQRIVLRKLARDEGLHASQQGWIRSGPGPLGQWTRDRDFPAPAAQSFSNWWASQEEEPRNNRLREGR